MIPIKKEKGMIDSREINLKIGFHVGYAMCFAQSQSTRFSPLSIIDKLSKDLSNYLGHEVQITSIIVNFIESLNQEGIEEIILWSDECRYQNRNVHLSDALFMLSQKLKITIVQNFIHAHMEKKTWKQTDTLPSTPHFSRFQHNKRCVDYTAWLVSGDLAVNCIKALKIHHRVCFIKCS